MPRQETIFTVFVASPSDVDDERNRLEEVIREYNQIWSRKFGARMELVRWESHAFPAFGDDAQAVINSQLPDDYDIFVGIMWHRFGTPTGRAGSGTEEEFNRARERHGAKPGSVRMMFYFKDAPVPLPPSKLDYGQLSKVANFRESLGDMGGLYWVYNTADEFESFIRIHLTKTMESLLDAHGHAEGREATSDAKLESSSSVVPMTDGPAASADLNHAGPQDDEGLIDLLERVEEEFNILTEIMGRLTAAVVEVGERITNRSEEIAEFNAGPDSGNRKMLKRLLAAAASDMDNFTNRANTDLPPFKHHLNEGVSALSRASMITFEDRSTQDAQEQAANNLKSIAEFRSTLNATEIHISSFRESVESLPRLTSTLNRSKRSMVATLRQLEAELQSAQTITRELEATYSPEGA